MFTSTEATLALFAVGLAVTACVTAYTTASTSSATVPVPAHRVAAADGGVSGAASPAAATSEDPDNCGCCGRRCARDEVCVGGTCVVESAACGGGCNPDVYVCNLASHRCVGNGSASVNLCTWNQAVSSDALACGVTGPVTFVDACRDPNNCGNCGVVCASGRCFWGECR